MVLKIGINGFGRIGRLVMRAAKADPAVQVRAHHNCALSSPPKTASPASAPLPRIRGIRLEPRPSNRPRAAQVVAVNDPFIPNDYMKYSAWTCPCHL